ncbi:unnamed protein product [Ostreobium quekettii]|uniref:Protein kinase domain-containing protein n=1 Tax=Ostreobium quekettii TaxID=121088 RepID=A0A8S1IY05_9CHLO|nr:unnamed protein product [Ostreobium quekettii]
MPIHPGGNHPGLPLSAVSLVAVGFLFLGRFFGGGSFPLGVGAWLEDGRPPEDGGHCGQSDCGAPADDYWPSIKLFTRTLMDVLLLAIFTIMAIVEVKAPGCVAQLYANSVKRRQHRRAKENRPRKAGANANTHLPENSFQKKSLRSKVHSTHKNLDKPIMSIDDAIVLRGGWQSRGRHGAVREGVCFDKDGRVWKVAIKSPVDKRDKASVQAINRECSALTTVPHHPNIVWVFGGRMGDDPVIVEELMATNLGRLLCESRFGLTYGDIVKIGLDVARGMRHLHEHGFAHFDITPSGILLDETRNAMLAGSSESRQTGMLNVCAASRGTPGYIAPECLQAGGAGELAVSDSSQPQADAEKIDVYSLGKVLIKCITGSLEVESATAERLCPASLWELVHTCVERRPEDRPGSEQVVEGLRGMLEGSGSGLDEWRLRRPKAKIWCVCE